MRNERRKRELSFIAFLLRKISTELEMRLSPIPMILDEIRLNTEPGKTFCLQLSEGLKLLRELSLSEIWNAAVKANFKAITAEEKQMLISLGETLGKYSAQIQLDELRICEARFSSLRDSMKDCTSSAKLSTQVAVGVSVLIMILLI